MLVQYYFFIASELYLYDIIVPITHGGGWNGTRNKAACIYQVHRVYNVGKEIGVFVYEDESMFEYEEVIQRVTIKNNEEI